jgi:dolichol-phosphate mannosyltransferase
MAGLSRARGDCAAVIDCDLQHPSKVLAQMVAVWREGKVDIVEGVKQHRGKESLLSKVCASLFYKVLERLSGLKLKDSSDFRLLDKRVVRILLDMPEQHPFFRGMSSWVGFNVHKIFFKVEDRAQGQSSFTFYRSAMYAIKNITTFSSLPMQFVSLIGLLYFVFAILLGFQVLSVWASGRAVEGFTTSILLTLITGAMIMLGQGITGHYIARIYEEIKSRPRVIIAKDAPNETSRESSVISAESKDHA